MYPSSYPSSIAIFLASDPAWPCPFPFQAEPHSPIFKERLPTSRHFQPMPTGSEGHSQVGIVLGALGLVLEGEAWCLEGVSAQKYPSQSLGAPWGNGQG